jgi:hypothetical protein
MRAEMGSYEHLGRFQRLIERAVAKGCLRADLDVAVAAAMLTGTMTPWSYRRFLAGRRPEQAAETIMASFLRGARA